MGFLANWHQPTLILQKLIFRQMRMAGLISNDWNEGRNGSDIFYFIAIKQSALTRELSYCWVFSWRVNFATLDFSVR
jgi:hypothetical protein